LIDFDALCLKSIYDALAIEATILTTGGRRKTVHVQDLSAGVEVSLGGTDTITVKAVAAVRMGELADNGVTLAELDDAQLDMGGNRWRITGAESKPSPNGEASGEAYLFLKDENLHER